MPTLEETAYKSAFGKRLKQAREVAGYEEAQDLANKMGLSPFRYRRWERGEVQPSPYHLSKFITVTNCDPAWLLGIRNK